MKKLDKRTKEYKAYAEWKANQEASPEGLGDSIEAFTEATGIKAAVKFLAGEDCGRRQKLNQIFRYNKPECLREDEYEYLSEFYSTNKNTIAGEDKVRLIQIYNRVFKTNKKLTSCGPCLKSTYDQLKQYFEYYQ
jgi:hypothetical protein